MKGETVMKIKNRELVSFINSQLGDKHLPVKLMFAISANVEEVDGKIKAYDKAKKELIDKYAKKDENGEPVVEGINYVFEDQDKWINDITELLEMEVDVNIVSVTLEDIAKCDEAEFDSLTVNEISSIRFMIKE